MVNGRGQIEVNERYQTALSHIYAVGDVVGYPGLASASYDQGRFAATLIADGEADWDLIKDIPTGIYTSPEISSVGRTEKELTIQRYDFRSVYDPVIVYEPGNRMHYVADRVPLRQ